MPLPSPAEWREFVRALPERTAGWDPPPDEVESFLAGRARQGRFLVMCSGGADSVFLLLWLLGRAELDWGRVRLWHCDHGLRGDESRKDAAFVEDLARALGLVCRTATLGPWERAPGEGILKRERDRQLAVELCREPADAVFTGHQANDVAENLLFRLARGSGLEGLSGLRPVQCFTGQAPRIRPLLGWSREKLREILVELGVPWREDASNARGDYTRNRLRRQVLPPLCAALPERDVLQGMLRSHAELRAANEWARKLAEDFLKEEGQAPRLSQAPLGALAPFVRERALKAWVRRHLPKAMHRWAVGLPWLEKAGWRRERSGWTVRFDGEDYRIEESKRPLPEAFRERLHAGMPLKLPSGSSLRVEPVTLSAEERERVLSGETSPGVQVWLTGLEAPLLVRRWQAGDRYRPLGAPGRRKLQDCFTDAGIERLQRHRLPILCDAFENIVWVPGLPPAHAYRIRPDTTGALWLTYIES